MKIRSPIFYMGNKLDLLDTLFMYFPKNEDVSLFIDLFGGSGVVSANVSYENVIYNELNENIVKMIELLYSEEPQDIVNHIEKRIKEFDMPNQNMDIRQPNLNSEIYMKAQKQYYEFRKFYNKSNKDYKDLLTIIHFSFCNLVRFNSKSEFNMPFGNRCYLKGEHDSDISNFSSSIKKKNFKILNMDALDLLQNGTFDKETFIYLDPPYSNTTAIYNENRAFGGWNETNDELLFIELDKLHKKGVKWAMSNVLQNKGIRNTHLEKWANDNCYKIIHLDEKQYSALGKGNAKSQEVLIINYKPPFEQYTIFDF